MTADPQRQGRRHCASRFLELGFLALFSSGFRRARTFDEFQWSELKIKADCPLPRRTGTVRRSGQRPRRQFNRYNEQPSIPICGRKEPDICGHRRLTSARGPAVSHHNRNSRNWNGDRELIFY
ncbi:hypothetical protein J6590_003423 [Homalodisca vitripennis]|nr:hypothetical protein J6590_003423 [Homalodisca vitripennis]